MALSIANSPVQYAKITASASGNTALLTAPTNQRIVVISLCLISNGSVNVKFISNATDITGLLYLAANSGVADRSDHGLFATLASTDVLNINLSGNVAVGGYMSYIITDI